MPFPELNRFKRPPVDIWPFQSELTFTNGLFGFEQYTQYLLVGHKDESPLLRLYITPKENPTFYFFVIDPFPIYPAYTPEISRADLQDIRVFYEGTLILLAIVDVKTSPFSMNLSSPLLIHWAKKQGKQLLMPNNPEYPLEF